LRHAHAVELAREGVSLNVIQRQLGHANSAQRASTCRGSTSRRSSRPCTHAERP
jgi:integrase